ncbi:uncharacterized protein KIAA1143 homolog [Haliotis rubra]|uniref:uncharacterized protein KIAA1143 homolog n=1 Tax=Haliotis rubra TaxID=36100 RepID=UPI001EE60CB2|nr:uncharacterized protein KIAA1143 homolog [Haliotis rubra]
MPGRGGRNARNGVQYVENDEPSFIKQFKQRIGYKEGPTVNTKLQQPEFDSDEDAPELDDEKPVVVVLKDGDLTEDQADNAKKESEKTAASVDDITSEGKITFKKPVKRSAESETNAELSVSTTGKKKKEKKDKQSSSKKVKNSNLLSFGDDEEEED